MKIKPKVKGYCLCCGVFEDDGLMLRLLPDTDAARRWIRKHYGEGVKKKYVAFRSRRKVNEEFARQMQLGLTAEREIADMLLYGGVSSDWDGQKAKTPKKSGIIKA